MASKASTGFEAIGRNPDTSRVSVKRMGNDVVIRIPLTGKAPLSKSEKSHLLGNTGGFTELLGLKDVRLNVCLTHKVGGAKISASEA